MERLDSCHHGMSLIELLIAMALGLALSLGVMQVYVMTRHTQTDLAAHIRLQETGRLALHFLLQELRAAGYPRCPAEQWPFLAIASFELPAFIHGWEAEGTAPDDIEDEYTYSREGTEVVASEHGWSTSGDETLEGFLLLPGSDVIQIRDICSSNVASAQHDPINEIHGTIFYVSKRGNLAENPPALFRRGSDDGRAEELFEGVASLQVLYGIANDGQAPAYVVATEVPDWEHLTSLRISLLLQSFDPPLQRTFSSTLALRPRLYQRGFPDIPHSSMHDLMEE